MAQRRAPAKHVPLQSPGQNTELFFCGGGSVLQPNHITKYVYPSLCGYPKECLRFQAPVNSFKRSRPIGSNSWGQDGHNFITISKSRKPPPASTNLQWDCWSVDARAKELESDNKLGMAMARVTKYVGNTLLESGKFQLKKGQSLVYVVRRTTMIALAGVMAGQFGREEEVYIIPCEKWRSLMPPTHPGHEHDTWWMRLHCLFQASFDRAYFHSIDNMNALEIPPQIYPWYPRPDIEAHATIFRERPDKHFEHLDEACVICGAEWFTESEYACLLKCQHFLCLDCLTQRMDFNCGKGNLASHEKDPKTKFFRCPLCRDINSTTTDRADLIRPDELPWWRWKICMHRMEREQKDRWLVRLHTLQHDGWFPPNIDIHSWDHNRQADEIKAYVHYQFAVEFMQVPKKIWRMLPYGFSLDNPVETREAAVLEDHLKKELRRLSATKQLFNTKELIDHMMKVGKDAFRPEVTGSKEERLGNPEYPPGYLAYREFFCEWTARGCFLSPTGRMDLLGFMKKMDDNKKSAWWKDEVDVNFDP